MMGSCPRCGRAGPYRAVVCDPCWQAETLPRLAANRIDPVHYVAAVDAELARKKR